MSIGSNLIKKKKTVFTEQGLWEVPLWQSHPVELKNVGTAINLSRFSWSFYFYRAELSMET